MASSDQILALIKSHMSGDDERFRLIAAQIAAAESKAGHKVVSSSIKQELNAKPVLSVRMRRVNAVNAELSEMVLEVDKGFVMKDLVSPSSVTDKVNRVIREYHHKEKLAEYRLQNRRKLLLAGPSGTGKTMTASVIANEVRLPLYVVLMEKVVTKFMGETSLKLSKIFDLIAQEPGVYLFDEFDAIGTQRGLDNEVGEQRRILNSFLQFMERDDSDSIIISATNSVESLDKALFRRFDEVINYQLPSPQEIEALILRQMDGFLPASICLEMIIPLFDKMSHAEITLVCRDVMKESLLMDKIVDYELISSVVAQRYLAYAN
ncbi:MAG: ATP-binding protein [Bacteroidales bacterium]|nr:ATP-binding protein [Candidatus Liminaster caballi]